MNVFQMFLRLPLSDHVDRSDWGSVARRCSLAGAALLLLAGCNGIPKPPVDVPDIKIPDLNIPGNTSSFKNRFYVGAGMGSVSNKPDTSGTSFTAGRDSGVGSHFRFGYDVHNLLAVEFDSALLGEANVNEGVGTSVKYSTFGASALFYGLTGVENRSRRERFSGFGKLGLAVNRKASNIDPLDRADSEVLVGAGVEYGFANGVGVRGEITRYGSESLFFGIGAVYRFGNLKRFVPTHLADSISRPKVEAREAARLEAARERMPRVYANDATGDGDPRHRVGSHSWGTQASSDAQQPWVVEVLASATDHDVDGIKNNLDKCPDSARGTLVSKDGCGLFDGTLGNSTFVTGSAGLNESTKASLNNLATRLIAFPEVRIAIEGHTDDKGAEEINLSVSRSRATMVRNYLIKQGVAPNQLEVLAFGESKPIATNSTEQGRDLNRRIEFVTLPSLTVAEISTGLRTALVGVPGAKNTSRNSKNRKSKSAKASKATAGSALARSATAEPVLGAAAAGIDLLPAGVVVPGLQIDDLSREVKFEIGTAALTSKGTDNVRKIAARLRRHPNLQVIVLAHTNSQPSEEENLKLSGLQAKSVVSLLVRSGLERRRLSGKGFGDRLPLVQNLDHTAAAVNRRVELRILP